MSTTMDGAAGSRHTPTAIARILVATLFVSVLGFGYVAATPDPAFAAGLSDPGALTFHDGSITVTTDGTVIENMEIKGTLRIEANNVTVRNTWIYGSEFWTVYVASGSARFENVEIGHPSHLGSRGIGGNNITAVSVDIHHVEDGIKLGSNSVYSGVRVHDLASPSSKPHTDAVQVEGRVSNAVVKNSVLSPLGSRGVGNAAVIIKSDFGPQSNITFANNYMNGGNYTIFVRDGGHGVPSDIRFTGNRFGPDRRYGLTSLDGSVTWENNTWADTGELIDTSGNVIGGGTATTTTAPATTTTTAPPTTTTTTAPATTTTTAPPTTTTTTAPATTTTTSTVPPDTLETSSTSSTVTPGEDPVTTAVADTSTTTTSTTTTTTVVVDDGSDEDVAAMFVTTVPPTFGAGDSTTEANVVFALMAGFMAVAVTLSVMSIRSAAA